MSKHQTDIIIVGAGPVGLFAVFEAGMLKMKCHVVDALDFIGGQCNALYPEKPIYDIPAHPQINAENLVDNLEEQIKPFSPTYHLGQTVDKLNKTAEGWEVQTSKGVTIQAKAVIIAAGCGAFGPHKPPLSDLDQFEETGAVQYMVRKIKNYADKKVVIAGGGDSAIDWVLSLAPVAESVALVHRRDKFRAAPDNVDKMRQLVKLGKVELVVPYQLAGLHGNAGKLEEVIVTDLDGDEKRLPADVLLPFYGLSMELGPIADWGLELDKKHIKVDPSNMKTNLDGVYAIGDIADYKGKLKLILTGFSEAAFAAHDAYKLVYPDTPLHFEYSTTKGV